MAQSISSAEPEKLFRYSDFGLRLDHELISEAGWLSSSLRHFEHTCTEPEFRMSVVHYADALGSHGTQCESLDSWVGTVGRGFLAADAGGLGKASAAILGATAVRPEPHRWEAAYQWVQSWPSRLGTFVESIEAPFWLKEIQKHLYWLRRGLQPDYVDFHQMDSGLVKPSKPFDNAKPTAFFGTYTSEDLAGHIHNGIDIVPDPYDPTEIYSVQPIGPGIVKKVGYEKDGYGNYIVIEHTLSDGTKVYSRYTHLAGRPTLKKDTEVDGDIELGIMGDTGNAQGAHVHLEVFWEDAYNPIEGYGKHTADEPFPDDVTITWLDKMKQGFVDPLRVINGELNWQFKKPSAL